MMRKSNPHLHEKFLNLNNLSSISKKDKNKIFFDWFLTYIFYGALAILVSLQGIETQTDYGKLILAFTTAFFLIANFHLIRFLYLSLKNNVFCKRWMPFLFVGLIALIGISFSLIGIFNVRITTKVEDGITYVIRNVNTFPLLIFFPIVMISYGFFSYYAFLGRFLKKKDAGIDLSE